MSGFKDDVLAILRDNVLLHGEAMGWIVGGGFSGHTSELYNELVSRNFPVTDRRTKPVILYDYIVVPSPVNMHGLLTYMCSLSRDGLLIVELDREKDESVPEYRSVALGFYAHRLVYNGRTYLVIHTGADYGN